MANTKVRLVGDPVLRTPCSPVDPVAIKLGDLDNLLAAMYDTMIEENGIGLAANQIGRSLRIFILKEESGYSEYINPEVISQEHLVEFEEGCLSIPGVSARTKRYSKIRLKWIDRDGINHEDDFSEIRAFAVQHEIDHLNGKLYVDQFGPLKKQMTLDKHKKWLKGY